MHPRTQLITQQTNTRYQGEKIKPGREVRFRFNDVILPKDIDKLTNRVKIQAKIVRSEEDEAPSHNTPGRSKTHPFSPC